MTFKPLINGIIQVMGEHDTGKTTFSLECGADPSRICFFDGDVKGRATIDQLASIDIELGEYHDLTALAENKNELEFFDAVISIINNIKKEKFDAIVFDTWGRFGKCFHPYVSANPSKFKRKWSPSGKIKGAEMWQEAQQYESRVLNQLGKLAPLVIIVSHLKDHWINNAKTGKQIPASSRTFNRVPGFRVWLRHNPSSPVPIGLVLKRVDKKIYVEGKGLRTVSVLPRKIVPIEGEVSLWDSIARYFDNPVGTREPTEDEIPNEFEMSILNGTLTAEQRYTLELMLKAGAVDTEEDLDLDEPNEIGVFVTEMKTQGADDPKIAYALKTTLNASYLEIQKVLGVGSVGEVVKMVKEGKSGS